MKQETDAQDIEKGRQPLVAAAESESRRRLIRGGLIGAPIILTLKSAPVLACNCKLPSGFSTSGNLSRNHGDTCDRPAYKPDYWKTHLTPPVKTRDGALKSKFLNTDVFTDKLFNSIFGGNDKRTLFQVLETGVNLASLVVSAYLGINSKPKHFVSGIFESDIKNMWRGSYVPNGSRIPWKANESENYLRYVMGLPLLEI